MKVSTRKRRALAAVGGLIVALTLAQSHGFQTHTIPIQKESVDTYGSGDSPEELGLREQQAHRILARTVENLPGTVRVEHAFVNLAYVRDLASSWYPEETPADWPLDSTVWVVAFTARGLTRDVVVPPPPMPLFERADVDGYQSPSVDGGYYVWSVETTELAAAGWLAARTGTNHWNTLSRLESVGTRIVTMGVRPNL